MRTYPDAIGIKTGFTKKSGRCLVSAAKRGGVTLVAVTLSAPDDWADHKELLDYGFSVCKTGLLTCDLSDISVKVCGSDKSAVGLRLSSERQGLSGCECILLIKSMLYAPVNEGDIIGRAVFVTGGRIAADIPVEASENAQYFKAQVQPVAQKKGFFTRLYEKIKEILFQR